MGSFERVCNLQIPNIRRRYEREKDTNVQGKPWQVRHPYSGYRITRTIHFKDFIYSLRLFASNKHDPFATTPRSKVKQKLFQSNPVICSFEKKNHVSGILKSNIRSNKRLILRMFTIYDENDKLRWQFNIPWIEPSSNKVLTESEVQIYWIWNFFFFGI